MLSERLAEQLRFLPLRRPLPTPLRAGQPPTSDEEAERLLEVLLEERERSSQRIAIIDAKIQLVLAYYCGHQSALQPVENYQPTDGVPVAFVATHQARIGQVQWSDKLYKEFDGADESPGNVNGLRWGTGGLIRDDLFLTAGHCLDPHAHGWVVPRRGNRPIPPEEIARLLQVNFLYQLDKAGKPRAEVKFPVVELVEYCEHGVDYAILRIGPDADGRLPSHSFESLPLATKDLPRGETLCLIQHPNGDYKQVETGTVFANVGGRIAYNNLDALGGSSGAPLLSLEGQIVGIHTEGGCRPRGDGANSGCAIERLRAVSPTLAAM